MTPANMRKRTAARKRTAKAKGLRYNANGGQQAYVPTPEQRGEVRGYAACGTPQDNIATLMGMDSTTLRRHFRVELDQGIARANATVGRSAFQQAVGGSGTEAEPADWHHAVPAMTIWWTKTRMGWKEAKQEIQHSGALGTYDLTKVSDRDLDTLEAILARANGAPDKDGAES